MKEKRANEVRVNQSSGWLAINRQFDCAYCGRLVVVTQRTDRRFKYCSAQCEKQYWREVSKGKRCTNLRTLSEGQMKRQLALEKYHD